MARLTEQGVERQKQQILLSALKLFNQKGFHGTKLDEVAKVSGISRSPIYYHFTDKKTLYIAVIDFAVGKWFENIETIRDQELDIFDMFESMLLESLKGEYIMSEIFLSELRLNTKNYEAVANRYFSQLKNTRVLLTNIIDEAKLKGNISKDANSKVIADNISGMNSGMIDMRRYFIEGEVKMFDMNVDDYVTTLIEEYISCLKARYKV